MRRKSSNFLEQYADKFILGIFAIVCVWLLIFHILGGSNSVEYDSKSYGPGEIDSYIETKARELENRLSMESDNQRQYKSRLGTYSSLLNSAVKGVDRGLSLPIPNFGTKVVYGKRNYHIPQIGQVQDVAVQLIRGVAYNPLQETGRRDETPVDELIDVDLITVQGSFDVPELSARFFENFAGRSLPKQWRDKGLAKPVFAAVQLERQQMTKDGDWSEEWQPIARPKVDPLKDLSEIPENVSELQLGVEILIVQFDRPEVKVGLLQPEPYDFTIPAESWLPPSLFTQRQERLEKLKQEEERIQREAERRRRRQEGRERDSRPARGIGVPGAAGGGGGMGGVPGGIGGGRPRTRNITDRTARRETRRVPGEIDRRGVKGRLDRDDEEEFVDELTLFEEIRLTEQTDFEEVVKALVFWAHDDTAQPGRTYRYRMRIGVFNPIAGSEWFDEECRQLKEQVILWSNYSDITRSVTVPNKLYFFPVKVRESDKTLTVDVRKYSLGKWYDRDFMVKPGEAIGQVVKLQDTDERMDFGPSSIDYRTGATLLDIVNVSDWFGTTMLRRRDYSDILYTQDGINIDHLPVQSRYWPSELRKKLEEIKKKQAEQEQLTLRGRRQPGRRTPGGPGTPGRTTPGVPGGGVPGGIRF
jgi:hypothetical protein